MTRFALAALSAFVAACGAPPRPTAPKRPIVVRADLPPGYSLDVVLRLQPGSARDTRLRVDPRVGPYLITPNTVVPLRRLPDGQPAKPFRIAKADPIGDVDWTYDGVMLIVVGSELGVLGEKGFTPILALPKSGMHVVAGDDEYSCLLFDPSDSSGRLYHYRKEGTVMELLRVPGPIRAVDGSPPEAFVATGGSLLRISGWDEVELLYDGAEPILAVADGSPGVFFSTANGTFYRSREGVVRRLMKESAVAIEKSGIDVFFHVDAVGIVRLDWFALTKWNNSSQ